MPPARFKHPAVATAAVIAVAALAVIAMTQPGGARAADCASVSDKYAGGTLAGVVAADCTAARTSRHLTDIRAFERLLSSP